MRIGLLFSHGATNKYPQEINFDAPSENNFLPGNTESVKATHFSAGVMLSYIHNL